MANRVLNNPIIIKTLRPFDIFLDEIIINYDIHRNSQILNIIDSINYYNIYIIIIIRKILKLRKKPELIFSFTFKMGR